MLFFLVISIIQCQSSFQACKNCKSCTSDPKLYSSFSISCPSGYLLKDSTCILSEITLLDFNFCNSSASSFFKIWNTYNPDFWFVQGLPSRGQYLPRESWIQTTASFSLFRQFSLFLWIHLLSFGYVVQTDSFQVISTPAFLILNAKSQSLKTCDIQINELRIERELGWTFLAVNMWQNGNDFHISINGKILTTEVQIFYYLNEMIKLGGAEAFTAHFSLLNDLQFTKKQIILSLCAFNEYEENKKCITCLPYRRSQECEVFKSYRRTQKTFKLGNLTLDNCPSLYRAEKDVCTVQEPSNLLISFHKPFAKTFGDSFLNFTANLSMANAYMRGLYFDGSTGRLNASSFQMSPNFTMHLFVMPQKQVGSIIRKGVTQVMFSLDLSSDGLKLIISGNIVSLKTTMQLNQWNSFYISSIIDTTPESTYTVYINRELSDTFKSSNIIDSNNTELFINIDYLFTGFIFEFSYSVSGRSKDSLILNSCSSCQVCPFSLRVCLYPCKLNEYSENCEKCSSECSSCIRSTSCSLNTDPLCETYTEYESCSICKSNTYLSIRGNEKTNPCCNYICNSCDSEQIFCDNCIGTGTYNEVCLTQCPTLTEYDEETRKCVLNDNDSRAFFNFEVTGDYVEDTSQSPIEATWSYLDEKKLNTNISLDGVLPGKQRGIYLNKKTMSIDFTFAPVFSMISWLKVERHEMFLTDKNKFHLNLYEERTEISFEAIPESLKFNSTWAVRSTVWSLVYLSVNIENKISVVRFGINQRLANEFSSEIKAYIFFPMSSLLLGSTREDSKFNGWINKIDYYLSYIQFSVFSSSFSSTSSTLSNCGPKEYITNSSCKSCNSDCATCIDDESCLVCADKSCYQCYDFYTTDCKRCKDGRAFNELTKQCMICPEACLTCWRLRVDRCFECAEGFFRSIHDLCVKNCPTGFQASFGKCVKIRDDGLMVWFKFTRVADPITDLAQGIYLNLGSAAVYDPLNQFEPRFLPFRGLFFNSQAYATLGPDSKKTEGLFFGNHHSINIWLFVQQDAEGNIFSSTSAASTVVNLSVFSNRGNLQFLISYIIELIDKSLNFRDSFSTISLVSSDQSLNTWLQLGLLFSYSNYTISLSLQVNFKVDKQITSGGRYLSEDQINSFKLGSDSKSFIGYLYSFKVQVPIASFQSRSLEPCSCPKCTDDGDCLITCSSSQFWDGSKCQPCSPACTLGCARIENCVLHPDPFCEYFEYLEKGKCLACVSLAEGLEDCKCVENSDPLSDFSKCICRSGYQIERKSCSRCLHWVKQTTPKYLDNFESIYFEFNQSVVDEGLTCDEIFDDLSLLGFGNGYSCRFTDSGRGLVLNLGNSASFVFGELSFRMGVLYFQESLCGSFASPFSTKVVNVTSIPETTSVLLAPSVVFYECEDLFLDGSQSSGSFKRPLQYRWTLSASPPSSLISSYSSSFQSSPTLLIAKSNLSTCNISATLEVQNVFGGLSSETVMIQSVFVQDLMLLYYDQKISAHFLPTVDNYYDFFARRCDAAKEVQIKWKLADVQQNVTKVDQDRLQQAQKRNGQIFIPANSFSSHSQVEIEVYIEENRTVLAQARLKLLALESKPQVSLSLANGTLSVQRDLQVTVQFDFDLQVEDYFEVFWNCSSTKCPEFQIKGYDLFLKAEILKNFGISEVFHFQLYYKDLLAKDSFGVLRTLEFNTSKDFYPWVNIVQTAIGSQPQVVNPQKDFTLETRLDPYPENITFRWTLSSTVLQKPLDMGDSPFVTVSSRILVSGAQYRLDLLVKYMESEADAETERTGNYFYQFYVNLPPTIERIEVSPEFGLEFSTLFQFTAINSHDSELNYPLKYVFGYLSNGQQVFLNLKNSSWTFWSQLPYTGGQTQVFVTVFDSLGAESSAFADCYVALNLEFNSFDYFEKVKKDYENVFFDFQTTVGMVSLLSEGILNRQLTISGKFSQVLKENVELLQDCFDFCIVGLNEMNKNIARFDYQAAQAVSKSLNLISLNPNLETTENFDSVSQFLENFLSQFEDRAGFSSKELKNFLNSEFNLGPLNNTLILNQTKVFNRAIKINNVVTGHYLKRVAFGKRIINKITSSEHQVVGLKIEKTANLSLKSETFESEVFFSESLQNSLNFSDLFISFLTVSQENVSNFVINADKFRSFVVDVSLYSNFTYFPVSLNDEFVNIRIPVVGMSSDDEIDCRYLDQKTLTWESKGCSLTSMENTSVVCSCSHLSAFVAFLKGGKDSISDTNIKQTYQVEKFKNINSINASGVYFCSSIILVYLISAFFAYKQDMVEMNSIGPLDYAFTKSPKTSRKLENPETPRANVSLNEDQEENDSNHDMDDNEINNKYDESINKKENFIDKFIKENSKSYKELMKSSHELFRLIFRPSISETRITLLTLFYLKILVQVFLLGLFYKERDLNKETLKYNSVKEAFIMYSKHDFWIMVWSTLISMAFIKIPGFLLVYSEKNSYLYPFRFRGLPRKLKIQRVAGYLLCFGFIVFLGISISLFSINFRNDIKNIWIVGTIVTVFQDIFVTSILKALLIIYIKKKISELILKRRQASIKKKRDLDN